MSLIKSILAGVLLLGTTVFLSAQDAGHAHEAVANAAEAVHATATTAGEHAVAAGEAVEHAAHEAGHAAEGHGEHHGLPAGAPVIKDFGFFKVSNSMVVTWIVALGLILFTQVATSNVKRIPSGLQNFAEWIVESLISFLGGILGDKMARKTFWFYASVFLFIVSANWFGLIPGVGSFGWGTPDAQGHLSHLSHPVLRGANADLNMTLALASVFFVLWLFWSVQSNGPGGFLAHIFLYRGDASGAMKALLLLIFFLVGFLEVISILIRPVSLTFRLYGNVYAGESLLETMHKMGGFLAALPFYGLELMVGIIQALVFTLLTAVFTSLMCHHDEDHAEGHGEEAHH